MLVKKPKLLPNLKANGQKYEKKALILGIKKTTISAEFDGGNIGVQFEVSATFRGKVVKPAIVMADGESANPGELVMFTTNGEGWQQIGEWYKNGKTWTRTFIPQDTDNLFGPKPTTNINGINFYTVNLTQLRGSTQAGPDKKLLLGSTLEVPI